MHIPDGYFATSSTAKRLIEEKEARSSAITSTAAPTSQREG
jgi:hypothetical protein